MNPENNWVWRESARWLKFLEVVEEGSGRWSKPHVATISVHTMIELRNLISNGTVLLNYESKNFKKTIEDLTNNFKDAYSLTDDVRSKLRHTLLLPQIHQCQDEHYRQLSILYNN